MNTVSTIIGKPTDVNPRKDMCTPRLSLIPTHTMFALAPAFEIHSHISASFASTSCPIICATAHLSRSRCHPGSYRARATTQAL